MTPVTPSIPAAPARLLPRHLHPGAWWLWALGLATAASRTTNPLLLVLVLAVTGYVVAVRRVDSPSARSYAAFLKLGLAVLAFRLAMHVVLGSPVGGQTVLLRLPEIPLPSWAAGIRLGGAVTAEGLVAVTYDSLRLATMLVCLGAANALASPHRLLRALPGALYEAGLVVVVAMTVAPQLVQSVGRVRAARRLRGRPDRGLRGMRGVAMPVLEGALERSLELAAAMDSRGYGRTGRAGSRRTRRLTAALLVTGLLGVCVGVYGLLDAGTPPALGLPVLATGAALAVAGLVLGGRRSPRTRYRPDPWRLPEWLVSASGVTAAVALGAAALAATPGLVPQTAPLAWPALPLVPALGVLAGLLPAVVAPAGVPAAGTSG